MLNTVYFYFYKIFKVTQLIDRENRRMVAGGQRERKMQAYCSMNRVSV